MNEKFKNTNIPLSIAFKQTPKSKNKIFARIERIIKRKRRRWREILEIGTDDAPEGFDFKNFFQPPFSEAIFVFLNLPRHFSHLLLFTDYGTFDGPKEEGCLRSSVRLLFCEDVKLF